MLRGARLAQGEPLSAIVAHFAQSWGIAARVLPMSDDPVATWLDTDAGALPFQSYFVELQCAPQVRAVRFEGAAAAQPAPGVVEAIRDADALFIAPSNPWLSIDPLLAIPGIAAALQQAKAPLVVISPLVGGTAVKGPTAKLIAEFGLAPTNAVIAEHYTGLIAGMVHDVSDAPPPALPALATATLMQTLEDKRHLAGEALVFALGLAR